MDIFIDRGKSEDTGTPGRLTIRQHEFNCDTLELPWRDNEKGKSCIIADTYNAEVWFSPHLGRRVLRLEDKHDREDCLLHNGNFAGDADLGMETQVHGCTLTGSGYADIERGDGGGMQHGIQHSVAMLETLLTAIGDGPHTVTYRWNPGCEPKDSGDASD
jgi:hypothetical protein